MHAPTCADTVLRRSRPTATRYPEPVWHATARGLLEAPPAAGITAPTLVVWGARDPILGRAGQDALVDAIPGSRLVIYDDVGHLPLWEAPDRVAADLDAFLKGL